MMTRLSRQLPLLREREFRFFFLARLSTELGDGLAPVALAFAALEVTGSAAALGLVLAAEMLPTALLVIVGGVIGDRFSRRGIMVAADLLRFGSQGLLALLLVIGQASLWHIVVLAAIGGAAHAFFAPAAQGLLPQLIDRERLAAANGLLSLARSTAMLTGPLLAAVLVVGVGAWGALALDAVSFGVSALLLLRLRHVGQMPAAEPSTFLRDLSVGWHEFRARSWVWMTTCQHAIFHLLVVAPVFTLGVVVADDLGGPGAWGAIVAGSGLGALLGGALALRWSPRRPLVAVALGTASVTPQVAALAAGAPVSVIVLGAVLAGAGITVQLIVWDTTLQRRVPGPVLARLRSYDLLVSLAALPLGYLLVGPLSSWLGNLDTLWLAGGVALASSLALLLVPSVRSMCEEDAAVVRLPFRVERTSG